MAGTTTQRYATALLGRPVTDYIAEQKARGQSYLSIALALREATAGQVAVSDESIRQWHLRAEAAPPSAGAA